MRVIAVPRGSRLSNSALKPKGDVYEQAVAAGGAGLMFARISLGPGGLVSLDAPKAVKDCFAGRESALVRQCLRCLTAQPEAPSPQVLASGAADGDLLLFCAGRHDVVSRTLDRVRQYVAKQLGEVPQGHCFLWVTDFPLFGWNEAEQRLEVRAGPGASSLAQLTPVWAGCAPPLYRAPFRRLGGRRRSIRACHRLRLRLQWR